MDAYNAGINYLCEKYGYTKQLISAGCDRLRKSRNKNEREKELNNDNNYCRIYNKQNLNPDDYHIHLLLTQYSASQSVKKELQLALHDIGIENLT